MPQILITGTHGPDDPTRATLPFHIAKGAKEAGFDVAIVLVADAPLLMKDVIKNSIFPVGLPSLNELFQFTIENNIEIYV